MKASARAQANAPIDVTFDAVRAVAEATPKREAMELQPPGYGKWVVGKGDVSMEVRLSEQGGATTIETLAHAPKQGVGAAWSAGILAPIVMPILYLQLRRAAKAIATGVKARAENDAVSAGRKLSQSGVGS
jgi:hypothetical protein